MPAPALRLVTRNPEFRGSANVQSQFTTFAPTVTIEPVQWQTPP